MSACIVFQQNKKSYVASDGAVSINFGEGNVRIKNDYKKTFCYENNLIFCSGRIRIVEVIVSEIKKKKDIKIEDIVQICRSNYANEGLLELFLTKYDEGVISYQLSSYNNFTPIKRVIDENNTEVLSLGFNASRNLETIFKHVGKCKSIEEMIENIYRDICCEEVGGTVDIYEISAMGIKNISTINLKDRMTITERFVAEGNLIVAETIVGRLLVGQNLIIANENNSMIIDKEGITIESNKLTIKGIEGQDYSFTSFFEMLNNRITLGVKNANNYTDAQIKITDEAIRSEVNNTKDNLQSQINQNAESITQKVSNSEFNTYKEQTANSISQKVSKGSEFSTEFSQNANGFDFKIGNSGTNVQLDKNGVNIRNGALTVTNSNGTVVIDGSSNIFKIFATHEVQLEAGNNLKYTYRIRHGMGYVPAYMAYQVGSVSMVGISNTLLPALTIESLTSEQLSTTAIIRANADENDIIITYVRTKTNIISNPRIKVYIFKERLL